MLYNLELTDLFPGEFDGEAHIEVWLNDPSWQGVRENVERLMNATDWAETTFAANVVFEPLVGEFSAASYLCGSLPCTTIF